uniref:THAP domain containing 8 n=1 Tax=Sphenodon punctatus TaxID=8508 RepID=A0A8D0H8I4_SPHPU
MPKYCRAPNCSNSAGQQRPDSKRLSFYKFPLHDPERLKQWLSKMNQEKWIPTKYQHLCSEHFSPSCFEHRWGVRYLKPDAVPTIFQKKENPTATRSFRVLLLLPSDPPPTPVESSYLVPSPTALVLIQVRPDGCGPEKGWCQDLPHPFPCGHAPY